MIQWKRKAAALLLGMFFAFTGAVGAHGAHVAVTTDGTPYEGEVRLVNRTAYVSL